MDGDNCAALLRAYRLVWLCSAVDSVKFLCSTEVTLVKSFSGQFGVLQEVEAEDWNSSTPKKGCGLI